MSTISSESEYVLNAEGNEVCPECGHICMDDGDGHYHDCRYFSLGDDFDEDDDASFEALEWKQPSLFRTLD